MIFLNLLCNFAKEFRLLPELLNIILTKAALVQIFSEETAKRESNESIFCNLALVDFLWWSSLKKYNLRNKIRHILKVYFQKAKKRSTIIRNNRNFLKEVIHPDRVISLMESCGCLTEDQVRFLNRLRNDKDKNYELLFMLQDFSSEKYSKMIDCLFLANQTPAAFVLERGGEAVKVHISNVKATRTKEFEMEFIERFKRMQAENKLIFNDLLNASVDERFDDVFILHAKEDEKGIEMWFWCKTESSSNQLKNLSDDDLREIIHHIYQQLIPEHSATLEPQLIQMNYGLASDFAERRLSIRHVRDHDNLRGFAVNGRKWWLPIFPEYLKCVTSLADKIYVVQEHKILAYENKYPYHALEPILLDHAGVLVSIVSCNIHKCLYVSFFGRYDIFKVVPELDNRVSQWLSETGMFLISVTSKGDVLVLQLKTGDNMLRIFTSEGTVKRTISMEHRLFEITSIQEITPDVVAVAYKQLDSEHMYIGIMNLDEDGTIFRHIDCQQKISSLTVFRYGDMFSGHNGRKNGADDLFDDVDDDDDDDDYEADDDDDDDDDDDLDDDDLDDDDLGDYGDDYDNYFGIVRLHQWPFKSKITRDLLKTDERIYSIHFAADQKQLYVLSHKKLQIYELKYEDEDYDS